MLSHIILNRVGLRTRKCHRYDKNVIDSYTTTYISPYVNIYPMIDKARSQMSKTRLFYFT